MDVGCDSSESTEPSSNDAGIDTGGTQACPESCCCPDIFDGAVAQGPCPAGFIFYCDECPFQKACQRDSGPPRAETGDGEADASDSDAIVDATLDAEAREGDGGDR
jgi:hypothetical protein